MKDIIQRKFNCAHKITAIIMVSKAKKQFNLQHIIKNTTKLYNPNTSTFKLHINKINKCYLYTLRRVPSMVL